MKLLKHYYTTFITTLFLLLFGQGVWGQNLSDNASNYSSWTNGTNLGTGFSPWSLTAGSNTGSFLGNPSNNGMGTTGIGTNAFGLYATGDAYMNAQRPFSNDMEVGDKFTFYWSINWTANGGGKGFDFKNGSTTIFIVNNSGSDAITAGGVTADANYGTTPMLVTLIRTSSTEYSFSMTRRSGGTTYNSTINSSLAINSVNFYIGNQNNSSGERNLYFNNLTIEKGRYRSKVSGAWNSSSTWEVSTDGGSTWNNANASPTSANGPIEILNTHEVTVSTTITIDQTTVNSGGTLKLNANAQLTVNGTLTNNGTLTLESGATLVQGASSTLAGTGGTYNVKQALTGGNDGTIPNGRFWYLGSPVSGASSSVYFASNAANVLKKRNEAGNTWTTITNAAPENLVVGQGYYRRAMGNDTINFTGGLLNNGAITIGSLTRTASQGFEGFNLVSNPYPSYLDWDQVTKTNVGTTMWYRSYNTTNSAMVFDTYVAGTTGGIGTNLNGTGVSNLIPPMQSFWVRVNSGSSTGSLTVNNAMRSHFTQINGSVAGLKSTSNERKLFIRMNLLQVNKKDELLKDQLIVYVNDQATNGFDIFDGEKMMQAGFPQFYTKTSNKKIVINALNSEKQRQAIPITMELPTTGVHNFIIEDLEISNGLVWLEDKQEEVIQALEPGTVYKFYANSGINSERFVLHFNIIDDTFPINVYNEVENYANYSEKGASVYAQAEGVVIIKLPVSNEGVTDIEIRDATGKLVYAGNTNILETSIQLPQANGIYYVTLKSSAGVHVRKVFIQQ